MRMNPVRVLIAVALLCAHAEAQTPRWWKGNTHTHTTLCGHADSTPEEVARWYHDRGWNFVVLSEHNRFIDPATVKLPEPCRADFLLVPGQEITGPKVIHTSAFGTRELVPWGFDSSQKFEIVQNHLDGARAAGGEAIVNHPNFHDALTSNDLKQVPDLRLFELYNGHPSVFNFGSAKNPPTEVLWADLLDAGLRVYGVSSDDAHTFKKWAPKESNAGRGWIFVRSTELSTPALLRALREGDFYASSGVVLEQLEIDSESYRLAVDPVATARELESDVLYGHHIDSAEPSEATAGWRIEFVGPANEVLATHTGFAAAHPRTPELPYLRARVTYWRRTTTGSECFYAWTQPAFRASAEPASKKPPQADAPPVRRDEFPTASSKKGLQVQMVDDAIALGIQHAAINVQLGHLLTLEERADGQANDPAGRFQGDDYYWNRTALAALDRQVEALAQSKIIVYAILLARRTHIAAIDRLLLHPAMHADAPNQLGAFRSTDTEGAAALAALLDQLSARYSPTSPHGQIWGWIVGNEVNSHHWWYNLGDADLETVADAYERAVRIAHHAITAQNPSARIYLSLEHHWNERYAAGKPTQAVAGRALLERFAALARERGDFAWHLAFHPYPENLFEPRTWFDQSAHANPDSPRITFRNLEQLPRFLERPELRYQGAVRRIILSEQGFHCPDRENGERDQAAAFAYAWKKTAALDGIDALILHRHVDHAAEGGLRLGLWTRRSDSVCDPERPRALYEVFKRCDQRESEDALRFALDVIGMQDWSALAADRALKDES